MAKKQSSLINMVLTLFVITAVAAVALGFVYYFTAEPIKKVQEEQLKKALSEVLPAFDHQQNDTVEGSAIYKAFDASNQQVGIAVETETNGFGGTVKLLVGFDNEGKIFGYSVLKHAETAGLGSKMGTWFQKDGKGNVIGKDLSNGAKVKKDGGDVDAITAATISSRAFCVGLEKAYATYLASINSNAQPAEEIAEPAEQTEVTDSISSENSTEVAENEGGNE